MANDKPTQAGEDQGRWEVIIVPNRVAPWESKYRIEVLRDSRDIGSTYADTLWGAKRAAKKIRKNWYWKNRTRTQQKEF